MQIDNDGKATEIGIKALTFTIPDKIAISVYPNPATEKVTVAFPEGTKLLELVQVNGKVIEHLVINANETAKTITVDRLPSGLYFLHLTTTNGTVSRKFIKR